MPAPSDNAKVTDIANSSGPTTRGRDSRNSNPQPTAPKPRAASENINEAGGPRQSTNPNAPGPGKEHKDIPLEAAQVDGDEKSAIGRLDTDRDHDNASREPAIQVNPTRPVASDKPGRER